MAVMEAIKYHPVVVTVGPAGTGKTYIPCFVAATKLIAGEIDKVIISRVRIPVGGEKVGELPGGIWQKFGPTMAPMLEAMKEAVGSNTFKELVREGKIEIVPFAFIRGRTFRNSFVILDEFQNTSPLQAKTVLTRIGENSTYVICGDLEQSDYPKPHNGLVDFLDLISQCSLPFPVIQYLPEDVVRSETCRMIVEAYNHRDNNHRRLRAC